MLFEQIVYNSCTVLITIEIVVENKFWSQYWQYKNKCLLIQVYPLAY